MSITLEIAIFLSMNGRAQEAIHFYKKHFNAKELLLVTYKNMEKRDCSEVFYKLCQGDKKL